MISTLQSSRDLDPTTFADYHRFPEAKCVYPDHVTVASAVDEFVTEETLRQSQDYDSGLHQVHAHFYEYGYRYYPVDFPDPKKTMIFKFLRDTTKDKNAEIGVTWNDAIQNTFGHLWKWDKDAPKDGFYVMHRVNPHSQYRVHLVHPELQDADEPESPAPFGRDDIYAQIRTVVNGMRVKSRSPKTVTGSLREIIKAGGAKHIRFAWDDIRGLTYVVSS